MNQKPVIGTLGGIGSGKSTVSRVFADLRCGIVDADAIGHALLLKENTVRKIVQKFGSSCLGINGEIDRRKLAKVCFSHEDKLQVLNNLLHPEILRICQEQIARFHDLPDIGAIVLDMPLLVEIGWEKKCDALVFVECSQEIRASRFCQKGQFDKKEQKKREIFQISLDKKRQIADYIINNNSSVSELEKQVEKVFSAIMLLR